MRSKLKCSVAMATFNGESFLSEQLDSFSRQSRLPDELVICDDRSTDSTLSILQEYSNSAPFEIKVVANDSNLGYLKNFEKAIAYCSGDIIFLSDQDDFWLDNKIYLIEKFFLAHPAVWLLKTDMFLADQELNRSGLTQLENIVNSGLPASRLFAGCGLAFRRSFADFMLPIPEIHFGHDRWLAEAADALGAAALVDTPLMLYRRHGKNESQALSSSLSPVSWLDGFREAGFSDASENWRRERVFYELLEQRLSSRRLCLEEMVEVGAVSSAISQLSEKQQRLDARITLVRRHRALRWIGVAKFWMRGGYDQFSSWKSALKDAVRP